MLKNQSNNFFFPQGLDLLEALEANNPTETGDQDFLGYLNTIEKKVMHHFKLEEDFMKTNNYPLLDNHKVMHDNFMLCLDYAKDQVLSENRDEELFIKLNDILLSWLSFHIHHEDNEISSFVENQTASL